MADIESAGRLVEQQDRRRLCQRPGKNGALALTATEVVEVPVGERQQEQRLHDRSGDLDVILSLTSKVRQVWSPPEQHIFDNRNTGGDHGILGDRKPLAGQEICGPTRGECSRRR